jgi:Tfp pilus assembly protein PilP
MKDKKIIILAVILLGLVGYYVWYANQTKMPESTGKVVDLASIDPNQALLKNLNRAIIKYKKENGSVPKSLNELKGKYLDAKTVDTALQRNFQYQYGNADSYRIVTPKGKAPVVLAAKKPGGAAPSTSASPAATTELATTDTGWKYDPTGKPDPFKPFILASAAPEEAPTVVRRQLTPLQKMPLSEIQAGLKAIIWGQLGSKALVEDATGKGYVVQEGTYVGQHDGIVKKIYQDRIIVEEYRRDPAKNRLEPSEVVLKLKKVEAEQ